MISLRLLLIYLRNGKWNNLVKCMVVCFLLFSIYILDHIPKPENIHHQIVEDNMIQNNKVYFQDADKFPGKCHIKNYEKIKYMAIVYTWVNGSQPCYRSLRKKHGGSRAVGGSRDREIGELMYSLRSLEKYMAWHKGPIYLVTPGHIPYWLDLKNPRIKVIDQDDLFPSYAKEFLPTFNTHVLEQFLYLIPGLTDLFMQINDDYIFTKPSVPHDFFTCNGGIKLLQERGLISHTPPTRKKGIWISSVLNTQQEMDLVWGKKDRYFLKHAPFVYSRHAFERIHQIFDRPMYKTLKSKFRAKGDMNNPLLHHYYMLHQGSKELHLPVELPTQDEMQGFRLILMKNNNMEKVKKQFQSILDGTHESKVLALNDEYSDMRVAKMARQFFQEFLPHPSQYELKRKDQIHPLSNRDPITCKLDPSILPPFPPQILHESKNTNIIIGVQEIRWISFINSIIRGAGLGIGFVVIIALYSYIIGQSPNIAMYRKHNAYDKV